MKREDDPMKKTLNYQLAALGDAIDYLIKATGIYKLIDWVDQKLFNIATWIHKNLTNRSNRE